MSAKPLRIALIQMSCEVEPRHNLDKAIAQYQFLANPNPEPETSFFGVWCSQNLGRINIFYDVGTEPDSIANIQMWM